MAKQDYGVCNSLMGKRVKFDNRIIGDVMAVLQDGNKLYLLICCIKTNELITVNSGDCQLVGKPF